MEVKPARISNKNLIKSALLQIEEETDFHIIDVEFGDTCFFFKGPKDSICHFHIKEIPGFKFAFWNTKRFDSLKEALESNNTLWSDSYRISSESELVFFTQYERNIDKFKPSYSSFLQGAYRQAWYEINSNNKRIKKEEWYLDDIPDILKFMHKHPIKSYIYSGYGKDKIYYEVSNFRALRIYIKDLKYHIQSSLKQWFELKYHISIAKKLVKKLKTMDYIVIERDGWSPKIEVRLAVQKEASSEDFEKDVNIIDKFDDKYFNKISIETWFECLISDPTTSKEENKKNNDLIKRFYQYINKIQKIINGKSKETLDDYSIKRIVELNIKEDK